jgi:hypothetical protein
MQKAPLLGMGLVWYSPVFIFADTLDTVHVTGFSNHIQESGNFILQVTGKSNGLYSLEPHGTAHL